MSETSETKMVCIGAVSVVAEQLSPENQNFFALNPDPFLLRLFASERVLSRVGQEAVKEIGFTFIGSSQWAARIMAMQDGDIALLPSQQGYYCVVHRSADDAALGILDIMPRYSMDWSEVSEVPDESRPPTIHV